MTRANIVKHMRVDKGSINDLIDAAWEKYKEGGRESILDAFTEAAADRAIGRYEEKIRAGFRRGGIELPDGALTMQTMQGIIGEQTGLELQGLSADSIVAAVDKLLSKRLSQALGVQVATVMDKDAMLDSINAAVLQAIKSGRAGEFVNRHAMHAARRYMAYKKAGVDPEAGPKINARKRARKYRKTHKLAWM